MQIKDPKFDLYEFVSLDWNGYIHPAKVVVRWFNANDNSWWYKVSGDFAGGGVSAKLYPETVLEHRYETEKSS